MKLFRAKIVNLIGYGEKVTMRRDGSWARDKYCLNLDGHYVVIKQRKRVLNIKKNSVRGQMVDSSSITVSKIKSFEDGVELVDDLCWLLSFATQSSVAAYEFTYGSRKKQRSIMASYNAWRPPFGSGIGKLSDFVTQAWPNYQKFKRNRPLSALIHMIDASDLSGALLESKITSSMQCLESIKSYFALTEGARFGIVEDKTGKFLDARGREISFGELLRRTLADVGMPLPPSFEKIKRLRNALVHRGFIRETDNVTRYIFGSLSAGEMHAAMFEVMEDVQDILREYMLRLLGYKGDFCTYSSHAHKTIS